MKRRNWIGAVLLLGVAGLLVASVLTTAPAQAGELQETDLAVEGMDCGGCAAAVNFVLARLDGVEDYRADYEEESAWVQFDPSELTAAAIVEALNQETPFRVSLQN